MRRPIAACTLLATLACGGTADARSIAVVPLAAEGMSAADAAGAADTVSATLSERGHEVVGPAETARRIDQIRPGCMASLRSSCRLDAAREIGVDTLVEGRLARDQATSDVTLSLQAIDVRTSRTIGDASHRAIAAGPGELQALAEAVTTSLLDRLPLPPRPARLYCASDPEGARVQVNGRPVGVTPWTGQVPEGPTVVVIEREGRVPESRQLHLQAGELQRIEVTLEIAVPRLGPEGRVAHPFDTIDGVLSTLALAGIAGGTAVAIASVAPGTRCDGERRDAEGDCEFVTRPGNLWPAAGAIAAGAVAGVVVLLRFVLGEEAPARADGRTAGIEGRF